MSDYNNFYNTFFETFESIEFCLNKNYVIPALCLIYSGIDSIAWVAYGDINVKDRFVKFVQDHMYAEKPLAPKPIDLYAARCAILHTMTPDSRLSNNNQAVRICYAYGEADLKDLQDSIQKLNPGAFSAVHINDLGKSFRLGVAHFIENDGENTDCTARMQKHYAQLSSDIVKIFNET